MIPKRKVQPALWVVRAGIRLGGGLGGYMNDLNIGVHRQQHNVCELRRFELVGIDLE